MSLINDIMKAWLNKHFGFSKGEFNGLIALIILLAIIIFIPYGYKQFLSLEKDNLDISLALQNIKLSNQENNYINYRHTAYSKDKKTTKLFNFDPNTIDQSGWEALGLSAKQALSIINYRNKGGKFFKTEDLKRMYTISPEMYEKLYPFVEIDKDALKGNKTDFPKYEKKEYIRKPLVIVEINQADSTQLDQIKGIGPAFALRILKYRDRLGGFYSKEQLLEVYGLDSLKFAEIKDQIAVNANTIKKININTAVFNDLKSCPYLSYKQMNAIIQYRRQHGNYTATSDLKKIAIINQHTLQKIAPYLIF